MPSPFPGMDPYLEDPDLWPEFHDRFASDLSAALNARLPPHYFARLGAREEISIYGDDEKVIVPDVAIHRTPRAGESGGVAIEEATETGTFFDVEIFVRAKTNFIEIVNSKQDTVVTVIEILSPVNKTGTGRDAFAARRQQILDSSSSYVEIDLLRRGDRSWPKPLMQDALERLEPRPDYLVTISRAWKRMHGFVVTLRPISLQKPLPAVPIPLGYEVPDVRIDLQAVFHTTYDSGPYRRGAVHYDRPPVVAVAPEQALWAAECLKARL